MQNGTDSATEDARAGQVEEGSRCNVVLDLGCEFADLVEEEIIESIHRLVFIWIAAVRALDCMH